MADAILKTCGKCGFERLLSEFRRDKRGSDGYWPRCQHCEPYGHRAKAVCGSCGQHKPLAKKCLHCDRRRKAEYKRRNAEKVSAAEAARKHRQWMAGAEARAARRAEKRANRPALRAAAKKRWKEKNPGLVNASTAQRFAAKMRATPAWADRHAMERLYVEAAARGVHVDHVVPLRSPLVCGLHCEANLQLLPPFENISKSNRRWPDMWEPV